MENSNDKVVLDYKLGYIISKDSKDKVSLIGSYYQQGSNYVEDVEIIVKLNNSKESFSTKLKYTGYNLELFLGDFNNDGLDEIMLRGSYGGSGGYAIASVFEYKDGKLNEIFSPEIFNESYTFKANYLINNIVEVVSSQLNEKFIFYIKNKPKIYLNMIYKENGEIKDDVSPIVSDINDAFPIKTIYSDNIYLFLRQRVIGVSNADTIGYIESFISLNENKVNIFNIGSFALGEKYFEKYQYDLLGERYKNVNNEDYKEFNYYVEEEQENNINIDLSDLRCIKTMDSVFIDFYNEQGEEVIKKRSLCLKDNLNEEKKSIKVSRASVNYKSTFNMPIEITNKFPIETEFLEIKSLQENKSLVRNNLDEKMKYILVPYLLDKKPYLALLNKEYESYSLNYNFRGEGINIKDLFVLSIAKEEFIFVGFELDSSINKLYILKMKDGRLIKAFDENQYYYNKIFIENLDKDKYYELIIWRNEIEEAYNIDIYDIKENGLKKTNTHDKEYYIKVVEYYKNLIDNYENSGVYSYYLALAYEKRREYKKAIVVIDKALDQDNPYPSKERLLELRKKLKKSIK